MAFLFLKSANGYKKRNLRGSMSIGQVMIFVSTFEKAKSFYLGLLGLEIAQDMSKEAGLLIIKNEGSYLTLHEGFTPVEVTRQQCRIVPIFKVKDIESMRTHLIANKIKLQSEIHETPVHRYLTLQDLDGNCIEVAQFKKG